MKHSNFVPRTRILVVFFNFIKLSNWHIDFRIAFAKELIGNFSNRQVNPISKPLFIGPGVPNEQFVNHQNTNLGMQTSQKVSRSDKENCLWLSEL